MMSFLFYLMTYTVDYLFKDSSISIQAKEEGYLNGIGNCIDRRDNPYKLTPYADDWYSGFDLGYQSFKNKLIQDDEKSLLLCKPKEQDS